MCAYETNSKEDVITLVFSRDNVMTSVLMRQRDDISVLT